jgi:hypothetical protein
VKNVNTSKPGSTEQREDPLSALSKEFSNLKVHKTYYAIPIEGVPKEEEEIPKRSTNTQDMGEWNPPRF